jgi:hypothetical protein
MQQSMEKLAGIKVTISKPLIEPSAITFLLPGAMIAISEYDAIRDILVHKNNQVVLSFYTNVLTTKHRVMAMWVKEIFNDYQRHAQTNFQQYNIVGHSVGAKIALLVATLTDISRVSIVVSLDPIDLNPAEFTSGRLKLADATASLCIAWACAGGRGISERSSPRAIYDTDPDAVATFVEFKDAGHMAFTDNGGGLPGMLMRSESKEGNSRAHAEALELVKRLLVGESTAALTS